MSKKQIVPEDITLKETYIWNSMYRKSINVGFTDKKAAKLGFEAINLFRLNPNQSGNDVVKDLSQLHPRFKIKGFKIKETNTNLAEP
jgi:hypothetical protein